MKHCTKKYKTTVTLQWVLIVYIKRVTVRNVAVVEHSDHHVIMI